MRFDCLTNSRNFVAGQVVHDDDVTLPENWCQKLFYPGPEGVTIHRTIEGHGCTEAIAAQSCNKSGCPPVAVRGFGQKPLTDRATTVAANHVGGEARLVDKDQARDIKG